MRREYEYENAIVELIFSDRFDLDKFKKSTVQFLKRVMEEKSRDGGSCASRIVNKE